MLQMCVPALSVVSVILWGALLLPSTVHSSSTSSTVAPLDHDNPKDEETDDSKNNYGSNDKEDLVLHNPENNRTHLPQ